MRITRKLAVLIACLAFGSSSCATLLYGPGPEQMVSIYTDPPGATVVVDDQQVVSPVTVTLNRHLETQIVATKPGYQTATTTLHSSYSWAAILDLIFIAPWLIDLHTDAVYTLSPDIVNLALTPDTTAQATDAK